MFDVAGDVLQNVGHNIVSCLIVGSLREDCDLYSRRGGKSTKKTLIMSEVTTIENPVGKLARRDFQNEKE